MQTFKAKLTDLLAGPRTEVNTVTAISAGLSGSPSYRKIMNVNVNEFGLWIENEDILVDVKRRQHSPGLRGWVARAITKNLETLSDNIASSRRLVGSDTGKVDAVAFFGDVKGIFDLGIIQNIEKHNPC